MKVFLGSDPTKMLQKPAITAIEPPSAPMKSQRLYTCRPWIIIVSSKVMTVSYNFIELPAFKVSVYEF